MAAAFHAPQPRVTALVTGTNGKTSVAAFLRQIWQHQGRPAASLGTLGVVAPGLMRAGALTTPDPVELHATLAALARAGVDHVAIEASSHGLDQYRLDGLDVAAAAFTNLSRDHLDYHGSLEAYRAAKFRLFAELLRGDGTAVLNADAPDFTALARIVRDRGIRVLSYGEAGADVRLVARRPDAAGQALTVAVAGDRREVRLPLVGAFQAMNALAALGLAIATGLAADQALAALAGLTGAPGRLEQVARLPGGASVVVDYAHTPDALATALLALRPHVAGRIVCVFGCGGDRDPGKRPEMGAAVAAHADIAIVTDDNPRGEDPALIRRAALAGAPHAIEIADRARAIAHGVALLGPGDLLLVAGKGHERGQVLADRVLPFDDAEVARAAVRARGEARP